MIELFSMYSYLGLPVVIIVVGCAFVSFGKELLKL
jgi:hypothetical protein